MIDPLAFFHVENRLANGSWHVFTSEPIQGRDAAEEHLAKIRAYATQTGQDPNGVRLRLLTETDFVGMLTDAEKNAIVLERIQSEGLARFVENLVKKRRAAQEREHANRKHPWFRV